MKLNIINKNNQTEKNLEDILVNNEKTLLYFYPKDNTPGCSTQAIDFTKYKKLFEDNEINIVGVSKDPCKSHINFIEKKKLSIDLISDEELVLHNKFGVIGEKNLYGKIYQGVIRSTFLLDQKGNILKEWRNVKAKGHVEKVMKELGIEF